MTSRIAPFMKLVTALDPGSLTVQEKVELSLTIDEMQNPARTMLHLWLSGFNCQETAEMLGRDRSKACQDLKAFAHLLQQAPWLARKRT